MNETRDGNLTWSFTLYTVPTEVEVGFEQDLYQVIEDQGPVEICAAILDPTTQQRLSSADLMTLDPNFEVVFNFSLAEVSATG